MNIDLEEIATVAIQEYVDLNMHDMFLHILEGWIFDREGLDFDQMIELAIKNKIDRKFKTLEINQMILDAIQNSVQSELEKVKQLISKEVKNNEA